jgi:peroxiredoxin
MTLPQLLAPPALAPDFTWQEGGESVRLAERCRERGAWVLFLPLAYAPVCKEDARGLAGAAARLGAPRRPLVIVSVDRGEHLRRFLDDSGGALLAHHGDATLELAGSYGTRRAEGFASRASFLVGRDGRIAASALHPIGFPRPLDLLQEWVTLVGG